MVRSGPRIGERGFHDCRRCRYGTRSDGGLEAWSGDGDPYDVAFPRE